MALQSVGGARELPAGVFVEQVGASDLTPGDFFTATFAARALVQGEARLCLPDVGDGEQYGVLMLSCALQELPHPQFERHVVHMEEGTRLV